MSSQIPQGAHESASAYYMQPQAQTQAQGQGQAQSQQGQGPPFQGGSSSQGFAQGTSHSPPGSSTYHSPVATSPNSGALPIAGMYTGGAHPGSPPPASSVSHAQQQQQQQPLSPRAPSSAGHGQGHGLPPALVPGTGAHAVPASPTSPVGSPPPPASSVHSHSYEHAQPQGPSFASAFAPGPPSVPAQPQPQPLRGSPAPAPAQAQGPAAASSPNPYAHPPIVQPQPLYAAGAGPATGGGARSPAAMPMPAPHAYGSPPPPQPGSALSPPPLGAGAGAAGGALAASSLVNTNANSHSHADSGSGAASPAATPYSRSSTPQYGGKLASGTNGSASGNGAASAGSAGGLQRGKTGRSRASAITRSGKSSKTSGGLSSATMSSRKREKLLPNRWAGAWMVAIFVESAVCITMAALAFGYIQARTNTQVQDLKTMSVYLALLVVGCVFQFLVGFDAVRLKNTLQVIGVLIFNVALAVAAALEIPQVRDALVAQDQYGGGVKCQAEDASQNCQAIQTLFPKVRAFLIVVPVVLGISEFVFASIAFRLWQEFAWSIYTNIGADRSLRNRYLVYQLYVVFLKFCFIFGIFFTSAYLILIANMNSWTYGITIAAVPIAVLVLILSAYAARRENAFLMGGSLILLLAGMLYFCWKLAQIYLPATERQYRYVRLSLTFISCFAIGTLLITIIIGIFVFANFGKGLKQAHETIGMFSFVRTNRGGAAAHAATSSEYAAGSAAHAHPGRTELEDAPADEMGFVGNGTASANGSAFRRQSNGGVLSPPPGGGSRLQKRMSLD